MSCTKLPPGPNGNVRKKNFLDHIAELDIKSTPSFMRLTGIVCTIGPACDSLQTLEKMLENGMNVARLNFSHGTHETHAETIKNLRTAVQNYSKKINRNYPLAIAIDTKGSEIRTGILEAGRNAEVDLISGEKISVTSDEKYMKKCNKSVIYVDFKNVAQVLKTGSKIYIDDGFLSLIVESTDPAQNTLKCVIESGGKLGSSKGVNLPGVNKNLPEKITEKDHTDFKFARDQDADFIFPSFTRNAREVRQIREIVGEKIKIFAKIENEQGIDNQDEIIREADGIYIDRGDLGSEISIEKVFLAQKGIIARCNKIGRPIIIATHLLESMVDKPRPTRAESADVANAVLDGADCVLLAGETAKGSYPVECVETLARICKEAESAVWQQQLFQDLTSSISVPLDAEHTTAMATVEASTNCEASAIIVVTKTGRTAQLISKYRPKCPIIAVTKNPQVARQLTVFRAVFPLVYEGPKLSNWTENVQTRIEYGIQYGKKLGFLKTGQLFVAVTGWKQGAGFTNTLSLLNVESATSNALTLCTGNLRYKSVYEVV